MTGTHTTWHLVPGSDKTLKPVALSWVDGYKPIGEVHVHPPCESLTCAQQGLHADQCHVEAAAVCMGDSACGVVPH